MTTHVESMTYAVSLVKAEEQAKVLIETEGPLPHEENLERLMMFAKMLDIGASMPKAKAPPD